MKKLKTLLVLAGLAFVAVGGWKAGYHQLNEMELQQDMLDLSRQVGIYTSYSMPRSDDEFRQAVVRDARNHDIRLDPSQVTVQRTTTDSTQKVYLAATYSEAVDMPGFSFELHFHPTSEKKLF